MTRGRGAFGAALTGGLLAGLAASAATPMGYMEGHGARAYPVAALGWGLLVISLAVIVIISVLVVWGVLARRAGSGREALGGVEIGRSPGLRWITIGVGISSVVLLGSLVWTVSTLAAVNAPPGRDPLTLEVTGNQWWWDVKYVDPARPDQVFRTANEIHIPTGRPVKVKLIGGDVIHSFWVPQLTGKTDAIPGQTNESWLEADQPGRYRGQCGEFCGHQHANMALFVQADLPADFEAWKANQISAAPPPITPVALSGEQTFVFRCGACHAVRGTEAGGVAGPDLTHLMSRQTIAAGVLPNTPAGLSGWIGNPQAIKPGTKMPVLYLSGPELTAVRTYLETLR